MKYLPTGLQMQAIDSYNINDLGITSAALMERAAFGVQKAAVSMTEPGDRVLFICGPGNNGADGIAAARMLLRAGRSPVILHTQDLSKESPEHRAQRQTAELLGIPSYRLDEAGVCPDLGGYALIVDAIFGVGLKRDIKGPAADLIERVNSSGVRVLAVDVPSGVSSADGQILGCAVRADATVTFGYAKLGMAMYPGKEYCGRIVIEDIGFFMPEGIENELAAALEKEDIDRLLPARDPGGNKGTFGKVLVAAGSPGMCGAAYFCALAAYRMGAGLVRVLTAKENVPVIQTLLPEAIVTAVTGNVPQQGQVRDCLEWADVLALGPGIGTGEYGRALCGLMLTERKIPAVIDADALNIISENDELFDLLDESAIVTPHIGEMSRLVNIPPARLKQDPVGYAKGFCGAYGAVCVLKDARTVTASSERVYINLSGNDGMATGGSGDALSGILAALLACRLPAYKAAPLGVYIHGLAGDAAKEKKGQRSVLASDIIDGITCVLKDSHTTGEQL